MTRDQLRRAVASGLHAAPGLATTTRYALTEFAANAERVLVGSFRNSAGDRCPLCAADPEVHLRKMTDAEWTFVSAYDSWIDTNVPGASDLFSYDPIVVV